MRTVDIHSDAFRQATLQSERLRVMGLLSASGVIVIANVVLSFVGLPPPAFSGLGILALLLSYEFVLLRTINRAISTNRALRPRTRVTSIVVETFTLGVFMVTLIEGGNFRPYQALNAPVVLVFSFLVILSILRLDPRISRLTGVTSATAYMLTTAYVYWRFPGLRTPQDFTLPVYATFGSYLWLSGVLAGWVAKQILVHVHAALREAEKRREKERLTRDLDTARAIQQGLLPTETPQVPGFEIAGWNQPADETGGDYYDWQTLPDGRTLVTLADVTGHGLGAALVSVACRTAARAILPEASDLGSGMQRTNNLLMADLEPGTLVTFVMAVVDPGSGQVTLLSAGHGPLLIYTAADDRFQRFAAHGVPFGVGADIPYGPAQNLTLSRGDVIILMTDGFFEWANAADEEFGVTRLETAVRSARTLPPAQIIERMYKAVTDYVGNVPQADDLTAVIIKRGES